MIFHRFEWCRKAKQKRKQLSGNNIYNSSLQIIKTQNEKAIGYTGKQGELLNF